MKKSFLKIMFGATLVALFSVGGSSAQSLKDLFNSGTVKDVVDQVTDNFTTLSTDQMAGSWKYNGFASSFESDDLLKQAGGAVVSSQIDQKLNSMGSKIGMSASTLSFTFTSGGEFTAKILSKSLSGSYTIDGKTKEIVLNFKAASFNLTSLNAQVSVSGNTMKLYFDADKLFKLLNWVVSLSKSGSLATISSLMSSYDGLLLGFELVK